MKNIDVFLLFYQYFFMLKDNKIINGFLIIFFAKKNKINLNYCRIFAFHLYHMIPLTAVFYLMWSN